ncbi:ras protein [Mycena vitilis]|nr:ras protein [Mycena vitilis]
MDKFRLAILGDGGVGKTALAVQFTMSCFVETYDPTIEDCYRKQCIVDNRMCHVEVIDTAGQEDYSILRNQWVREGDGFALVYSIDSRTTFDRLETFHQSVMRAKTDHILILVGNKSDRAFDREVSKEEGGTQARHFRCSFIETSAKTAQNVDRVFMSLVRMLREKRNLAAAGSEGPREKRKCVIL